jgi:hypothetical protein
MNPFRRLLLTVGEGLEGVEKNNPEQKVKIPKME